VFIFFIDTGRAELGSLLKLCDPLTSMADVTALKDWLAETWVNLAMADYPYPVNFLEPLPAWPIKVMRTFVSFGNLSVVAKFDEGILICSDLLCCEI